MINRHEVEEATSYVGHVIALQRKVTNLSVGLAENAETRRTVVRVNHINETANGPQFIAYDADGVRFIIDPSIVDFEDLGPARAGWGSW